MVQHYFSKNPKVELKEKEINITINGKQLKLITPSGVFSFGRLDRGTELLIKSLELNKKDNFLDLGCGYGIIGIYSSFQVNKVLMSDINNRAVIYSKKNIKLNKIKNAEAIQSDGFKNIKDKFDIITLNPPIHIGKKEVFSIIKDAKEHLNNEGSLYIVIKTTLGSKSYEEFLTTLFLKVSTVKKGSGYRVFRAE